MRVLVTGAAGFIGSHVVEALAKRGHSVHGLDAFTDAYDVARKRANRDEIADQLVGFTECDLACDSLDTAVGQADVIVHLAAIPGVRGSWGSAFDGYVRTNIVGTQRLLEAATNVGVRSVVFGSSSSVYGETGSAVVDESWPQHPISPYGVTKSAAEALCGAYASSHQLSAITLRFFPVYGPRQRPDMAIARALDAVRGGPPFRLHGDGTQRRAFTFVGDVVRAVVAACEADLTRGMLALNISSGTDNSVREMLATVEAVMGTPVPVVVGAQQPGDPTALRGCIDNAEAALDWRPEVGLAEGIARQVRSLPQLVLRH
jgi:UDP-glucuronate 4-epimerase